MALIQTGEHMLTFFCGQCVVDTARNGKIWVNTTSANLVNDILAVSTQFNSPNGQLGVSIDQANHITGGRIVVKAKDQIWSSQLKEVHAVALDDLAHVHQL
jgi:hypothetical protein